MREHRSLRSIDGVAVIQLEAWVGEIGKFTRLILSALCEDWKLPAGTAHAVPVAAFRPSPNTHKPRIFPFLLMLLCPLGLFNRKSPSFPW